MSCVICGVAKICVYAAAYSTPKINNVPARAIIDLRKNNPAINIMHSAPIPKLLGSVSSEKYNAQPIAAKNGVHKNMFWD